MRFMMKIFTDIDIQIEIMAQLMSKTNYISIFVILKRIEHVIKMDETQHRPIYLIFFICKSIYINVASIKSMHFSKLRNNVFDLTI